MSLANLSSPNVFNECITSNLSLYGQLNAPNTMSTSNKVNTIAVPLMLLQPTDVLNNVITFVLLANGNAQLPEPETVLGMITQVGQVPVGYTFDFVISNMSAAAFAVTLANSASGRFSLAGGAIANPGQNNAYKIHCIVTLSSSTVPAIVCYPIVSLNSNINSTLTPYMNNTVFTGTSAGAINFTTSTSTQILNALGMNSSQYIGTYFDFTVINQSNANNITLVAGVGVVLIGTPIFLPLSTYVIKCLIVNTNPAAAAQIQMFP